MGDGMSDCGSVTRYPLDGEQLGETDGAKEGFFEEYLHLESRRPWAKTLPCVGDSEKLGERLPSATSRDGIDGGWDVGIRVFYGYLSAFAEETENHRERWKDQI